MNEKVKRLRPDAEDRGFGIVPDMYDDPEGDYVRYEDYAAAEERAKVAERLVAEAPSFDTLSAREAIRTEYIKLCGVEISRLTAEVEEWKKKAESK